MNSPFDQAAKDYDTTFTHSHIGKLQRERVYYWLKKQHLLSGKKHFFEINCGTGYDANLLYQKGHSVMATDASVEMIKKAQKERNPAITFLPLSFQEVPKHQGIKETDVMFSNFGGLNCISSNELQQFIHQITDVLQQKSIIAFVIMPTFCFIETLYFLITFRWKKMFRRNTTKAVQVKVNNTMVPTYYHAPKTLKKMLQPNFTIKLIKPIAICLPPSYMEKTFKKHLFLLKLLYGLEKIGGHVSFLSAWSDHYIIVAEKK